MIYDWYGDQARSSWFGRCCGAMYQKNVTDKTNLYSGHKGIKILSGIYGQEYNGPVQSLTHVQTRNGPLTISIRKVY